MRRNIDGGRALTARSVLLSVLLGSDPPRLPVLLLVRTTQLFGIAEGTTRTALSRMAAAGEVTAHGAAYELTGPGLLRRQERQTSSRLGVTREWDRRWVQAVTGVDGRRSAAERATVRQALSAARLAELREGVWLRPDNLDERRGVDGARWFTVDTDDDPVTLAARLWDLDAWSTTATDLVRSMDRLVGPLEDGDRRALADGFVLSAAVLRHFQADPLLPAALLPERWPGDALRREYDRYDRAYRSVLSAWFREQR